MLFRSNFTKPQYDTVYAILSEQEGKTQEQRIEELWKHINTRRRPQPPPSPITTRNDEDGDDDDSDDNENGNEKMVYNAVKGMMAKNALNRHALNRLKVYNTSEHPHEAQKPKQLSI